MNNEDLHNNKDTFLASWLAGELSDAQFKHLVSDEDYRAYLKLRRGITINEALEDSVDESFQKIKSHISNKKSKTTPVFKPWLFGVAASVILLLGLFKLMDNNDVVIETGYGESRSITLLDGSEVILNSKSQLSFNDVLWQTERTLTLDGEAYFKVAKGETFTVKTNNGEVSVLGTQFNVISKKDFFDVVCYEGKVGVKTQGTDHILLPKDAIRKVNGYTPQQSKHLLNSPTWINGESSFKSVALRYVIKALEDQYRISFDSEEINYNDVYTGSFPHDNLEMALKTVFETLNISYTEKENRNIKLRYKK